MRLRYHLFRPLHQKLPFVLIIKLNFPSEERFDLIHQGHNQIFRSCGREPIQNSLFVICASKSWPSENSKKFNSGWVTVIPEHMCLCDYSFAFFSIKVANKNINFVTQVSIKSWFSFKSASSSRKSKNFKKFNCFELSLYSNTYLP